MKRIINFIPVQHGDLIDLGDLGLLGISGNAKYLGFKPGRSGKREGWLVVAMGGNNPPKKKRK